MLRLALAGLAVLAAGGAAWLAYTGLSDAPAAPVRAEALPMSEVLTATTGIARGAALGPANLAWTAWPEQAIAPDMINRASAPDAIDTYAGWIARADLAAGHPVQMGRIADGTAGLMALALAPGMRAMAVQTSAENSAGGFIMPDDRVDVVNTVQQDIDGDGEEEPVSLTIIENVRVLAVDQSAEQEDGEIAKVGDTVTLELTPLQVELLTTARNAGRVSLTLRSVSDFGEVALGDLAMVPGLALMMGPEADLAAMAAEPLVGPYYPDPEGAGPPPSEQAEAPSGPNAEDAGTEIEDVEVRVIGSGTVETVYVEPAREALLLADPAEGPAQ